MMNNNFESMLATRESAAQNTLVDAMCEWWMASDRADALSQINANPASDLAGIKNSVVSGLIKAAELLGCKPKELILEQDLTPLAALTADQIVLVLDAIHRQWIEDNFSARRWGEKYFKGQLGQYRKTSRIAWVEVAKDLLFVKRYLVAGGNMVSEAEIEEAFNAYVVADKSDDDLQVIAERARELASDIVAGINAFREKSLKKEALVAEIDAFLAEHTDPAEIMEIMIAAI